MAKIVVGTGCNGTWLLKGEGSMFEHPVELPEGNAISYVMIKGAINLIEEYEKSVANGDNTDWSSELEIKLAKLLVNLLEKRGQTNR